MSHDHSGDAPKSGLRLAIVIGLNFVITAAEIVGGLISGSLSLISDALHNFSDGIAVIIAWIAIRLDRRPRTDQYTFGLHRAQVLAAVVNAGVLIAISVYLFIEAWHRLVDPRPIEGGVMAAVAGVGLVANVLGTWLLRRGSTQNMNLRAAYLHLFSDAVSSIGVILGGLAVVFLGVTWVDPLLTVLIGVYVMKESLAILSDALGILMLRTPGDLSLEEVRAAIRAVPGVVDIHHLHLWEVVEHDIHFEGHVVLEDQPLHDVEPIRFAIEALLQERFDIGHTTLQFEAADGRCATAEVT